MGPGHKDRVTGFTYTGLNRLKILTAYNGSTKTQTTTYDYTDDYNAGLVTRVIYPDGDTGDDNVTLTYNFDGSPATRIDQRGAKITYHYTAQRQVEAEAVDLGSLVSGQDVDSTVLAITRKYDDLGRTQFVTSHSSAQTTGDNGMGGVNSTAAVNQIKYTFDATYGLLVKSEQEHDGAVDGSTLSVKYTYDTTATSSILNDGLRLYTFQYPWHQENSKYVQLYYGSSGSATFDRFDRLGQISGQFQQTGSYPISDHYNYAGIGRLWTARTRWANGGANQLLLYYDGAALGTGYKGYDRFGRVRGHSTSGGSAQSGFHYEYDYAGNRTSRDTIAPTNNVWDQKYAYDGLHRLKGSDQGTLSSGSISSPTFEEGYALDQLGN